MFASCGHNVLRGLRGRLLAERPPIVDLSGFKWAMRRLADLCRAFDVTPWSYERVLGVYTGRKLRKYRAAYDDLLGGKWSSKEARVTVFSKVEALAQRDSNTIVYDPRIVCFRGNMFNLKFARFTKPLDGTLKTLKNTGRLTGLKSGLRLFSKGLNDEQLANLVLAKHAIVGGKIVGLDMKRFDGSVTREHLKAVHSVYRSMIRDDELDELLNLRLRKIIGRSFHGIRFTSDPAMFSGEMDTSLADSLLCLGAVVGAMKQLGISGYDIVVDGDDSLIFVKDVNVEELIGEILKFGFRATLECETSDLDDVVYNRKKIVDLGSGVSKMVRDPVRVCSQAFVTYRHHATEKEYWSYVKTVAWCLWNANSGVPVLMEFFEFVCQRLKDYRVNGNLLDGTNLKKFLKERTKDDVSVVAKRNFERVFGIQDCDMAVSHLKVWFESNLGPVRREARAGFGARGTYFAEDPI